MYNWSRIQGKIQETIEVLHEELGWFNSEELQNTAKRITNFYKEWVQNRDFNFTVFENIDYDQLIILKNINFYSMCSHHMLPFSGHIHIAYLPGEQICGLSKLARAAIGLASKPQVQEFLTNEITEYLWNKLKPKFVMTVVEAAHLCMLCRGIKQHTSKMITSSIKYDKNDPNIDWKAIKSEVLELIRGG